MSALAQENRFVAVPLAFGPERRGSCVIFVRVFLHLRVVKCDLLNPEMALLRQKRCPVVVNQSLVNSPGRLITFTNYFLNRGSHISFAISSFIPRLNYLGLIDRGFGVQLEYLIVDLLNFLMKSVLNFLVYLMQ